MRPIETAPSNTPVLIWNHDHPEWGAHVMEHVRGRWRGRAYTLAGVARTTWDTDNYEGPTHWEPVE